MTIESKLEDVAHTYSYADQPTTIPRAQMLEALRRAAALAYEDAARQADEDDIDRARGELVQSTGDAIRAKAAALRGGR